MDTKETPKWKAVAILALGSAIGGIVILAITTIVYQFIPLAELLYYPALVIIVCIALFIGAVERMAPDPFKKE